MRPLSAHVVRPRDAGLLALGPERERCTAIASLYCADWSPPRHWKRSHALLLQLHVCGLAHESWAQSACRVAVLSTRAVNSVAQATRTAMALLKGITRAGLCNASCPWLLYT